MRLRGSPVSVPVGVIPLLLAFAGGLFAQTPAPSTDLSDVDNVIAGLRQVSKDLSETVRRFRSHIDETIAKYDRGYRLSDGRQVQTADADLTEGPPDVMQLTVRRFVAFRMLAARSEYYHPAALADMDRIQQLIAQAHARASAGTTILRQLLVVSVKDFDPLRDAEIEARHDQLLKAWAKAEDMAKLAWIELPIELPEGDSKAEIDQKAWDVMANGLPRRQANALPEKPNKPVPMLLAGVERRKRITLVNEPSYRMALTDSGREDENGLHYFYQEEWVQRGTSVIRMRWRVAVDTLTGRHILIKRYPIVELRGFLNDIYSHLNPDELWYVEPTEEASEPSPEEVESTLAEVADSRAAVLKAALDFRHAIHEALTLHDLHSANAGEEPLDAGLSASLRETLFAIRAHMAGVSVILDAENNILRAVQEATRIVADLQPLAAWANGVPEERSAKALGSTRLLDRSDREIALVRNMEKEALALLPPDLSQAEARFPALQRNLIVRIRRVSRNPMDGSVRCLQEIWRLETPMRGSREVRRTVTLVIVDPKTGSQTPVGGRTQYYKAAPGDLLEEIFDEYAADDLLIADRS